MDRKEYWNKNYTEYWKSVTEEAEQTGAKDSNVKKLSGHDFKSPDIKVITSFFERISYSNTDKLLDYGCGFGRFYPFFSNRCDYYGIDISQSMIETCQKQWPEEKGRFLVAEGENLPFDDQYFDRVVCQGVFDACYQEQALEEMFRVAKEGGIIIISGKNDRYFYDDEEAYVAEVNARKKEHPNFFTNVPFMMKQIKKYADVLRGEFFLRRGDWAKEEYVCEIPERFYEWRLILQKNNGDTPIFERFSDKYSLTWKEKNNV